MKLSRKYKAWVWIGSLFLLGLLGTLAFIYLPARGSLPELAAPDYWPTDAWKTTPAEQQGIESDLLADEIRSIQQKHIAMDSLLIVRNGYVVLDANFSPYDGSFPHDLASITKSVMTTLIGIAVDQGKLHLDQKMVSIFPDRSIANLDDRKMQLTVLDLANTRNGMQSGCLEGDEQTLDAMRAAPDWVQAALDRPMVNDPGTHFCYDSPGMHLLSAILQEATGLTAFEFAQQYLFEPLGISDVVWLTDPQGYTHGWGDLHMKPGDVAKLGLLWLHGGIWDGRQIVSGSWVSGSVQAHSRMVGNEYGYGYGWWITPFDFYAMGREGQYLHVIPSKNMIVVITAGGMDFNQLLPFFVKLYLSTGKELPDNPKGQASLTAAVSQVSQSLNSPHSIRQPATTALISGLTYSCETNPIALTNLRLDFNNPVEAGLSLQMNGQAIFWPIGLDGKYRLATDGQAQQGFWEDEHTFVVNIFDIGQVTRTLYFDAENLRVSIPELGLTISCLAQ